MTNEQAKQEAIKKAYERIGYIELFELANNVGWVTVKSGQYDIPIFERLNVNNEKVFIRPKSLTGFSDNNGWIRIEPDGSNLPTDDGNLNHSYSVFDIKNSDEEDMTYLMKTHANGVIQLFKQDRITHYKPIKEEPKPVY